MAVSLKNGLVLDSVTVKAGRTPAAHLEKTPDMLPKPDGRRGKLVLDSCDYPTGYDPRTSTEDLAFALSATVTASKFTPQQLHENRVRLIQFVRFNTYISTYRGRKPSDGLVIVQGKGDLSHRWLLDCLTDETATTPIGAPFTDVRLIPPRDNTYFVRMTDAPSKVSPLDHHNRKTDRWNFLANAEFDALFVTGVVFVHKGGEIEPFMGVQWRLRMEADVVWRGGDVAFPVVTEVTYSLEADEPKTLDATHPLYTQFQHPPPGSECAVVVVNRALTNVLTDPAISIEEYDQDPSPVHQFWV